MEPFGKDLIGSLDMLVLLERGHDCVQDFGAYLEGVLMRWSFLNQLLHVSKKNRLED